MNANLLKGKIVEYGFTIYNMAETIGVSRCAFYRKIKGESEFTRDEIEKLSEALGLNSQQIMDIFFKKQVS